MKVYISADIEGITGINHWDETSKGKLGYDYFASQMTAEVNAACKGALNAGADEIIIKDAHESGRNIDISKLPEKVKIIRGWSGHPFSMVQELDRTFDAAIFIGYHSYAGSDGNPLSHTMHVTKIDSIKINDIYASEFLLHMYTAAYVGVPVVFVSGDKKLGEHIKEINNEIGFKGVIEGIGNSVLSIHPNIALRDITTGVESALKRDYSLCKINLPRKFEVKIKFSDHYDAYKASFYPNMVKLSEREVLFETDDYFEVMRMMLFVI